MVLLVEDDSDVSGLCLGRPDPPDAPWALHLGHDDLVALLADEALTVPVLVPRDILARCLIVRAVPVVA